MYLQYVMQYVETPIEDAIEIIQSITCPDKSKCRDRTTCCPNNDGGYGCCPFPEAVCCEDGYTCCHQGLTCCKRHDGGYGCCPVPEAVCCKYGVTCCSHATTCCDFGGYFSCCNLPDAVCCKHVKGCCPHGTQCDEQHGHCIRKFNKIDPLMEKVSPFINFWIFLLTCK